MGGKHDGSSGRVCRAFPPGARIEANEIAAADGVSPTPVRNALKRLAGAGFIVSHSNEGFFAPSCTEQGLRDLYDCCAELLGLAIRRAARARRRAKPVAIEDDDADEETALRTERILFAVMSICANRRLLAIFSDVSLRLRPARLLEGRWIAHRNAELNRIAGVLERRDFEELDRLIGAYYRRRLRYVSKIVACMQERNDYRMDGA